MVKKKWSQTGGKQKYPTFKVNNQKLKIQDKNVAKTHEAII